MGLPSLDLRDRSGIVQVAVDGGPAPEALAVAEKVRSEYCLSVVGLVRRRPAGSENENLPNGTIEVAASAIDILNPSKTPPFPIAEEKDSSINEMLRLKYRYLDLRRPVMFEKMRLRHEAIRLIREFMYGRGFLEIETPVLTKSSPEGARDYLVPYRLEPGLFYALPQAPQQFKQLLMVGGIERYFQIAKCFRDESQRADRQPEFTQLDFGDVVCRAGRRAGSRRVAIFRDYPEDFAEVGGDAVHTPDFRRKHGPLRHGQARPALRLRAERRWAAAPKHPVLGLPVYACGGEPGQADPLPIKARRLSRKEIDDLTALGQRNRREGPGVSACDGRRR